MKAGLDSLKSDPRVLQLYRSRLPELHQDGKLWVSRCPFHQEDTPSFKINQKDGAWLWRCFGACQTSGSIICFVERFDHVSTKEAITTVQQELGAGNDWNQMTRKVEETFQEVTVGSNKSTKKTLPLEKYEALERALHKSETARAWLLEQRGITYETARKLRLGFRQNLGGIAGQRNSDISGLGWIAMPCIKGDRVVSIKYRSIHRKAFARQPDMATALFGADSIEPTEPVYLVEGEFDAAVLTQCGFCAVSVPSAGFNLTPEMRSILKEADEIILAGENDAAGQPYMEKLWQEFGERTYRLKWSEGMKDANQTFLEYCERDEHKFQSLVKELTTQARSRPVPHVYSLVEALRVSKQSSLADHPARLRFPWPSVDNMAILLPGSVMALFATQTKMGKTQFVAQTTLHNAVNYNHVVVNYQCELQLEEYANITASHVLHRDRNHLTHEDYLLAAEKLSGVRYYVGRNPTLNTVGPVLDLIENAIRVLGATIVVLDHIHFICRNEKDEIKAQADASQRIKNMADKYGVIFIVVGQPRKAGKQDRGKVVHISDMKGSEAIISDSSAAFALHRDWIKIKDPNNPPKDDFEPKTEVHLLGARSKGDGATYTELYFMGKFCTYTEISRDEVLETSDSPVR